MLDESKARKIIKATVKGSIISFAKRSLKKKSKFQILDLLIPKERKIRSIVGGLETSIGTTLWEPLAKALATENGFTVIDRKLECPVHMPINLINILQILIEDRRRDKYSQNAKGCHEQIKAVCQSFITRKIDSFEAASKGKGVDLWLKKNEINYFFDIKTVQPNLGAFKGLMEEILYWYAYFYSRYPTEKAEARIVFPYDPYKGDFWQKKRKLPLEQDNELWIGTQFWDFCSGLTNTYKLIEEVFNKIFKTRELEKELESLFK